MTLEVSNKKGAAEVAAELRASLLCGGCKSSNFQCWNVSMGAAQISAAREHWRMDYQIRCDYFKITVFEPEKMVFCEAFKLKV